MPNVLNYVDYDFDTLVTQLQNRLKIKDAWKDAYRSGTGQMMIEFYACVSNLILYYVERRAEEIYIDTARNKSSVVNMVKLLNYLPKRKTSSVGLLTFSLSEAHTADIYINKFTMVKSANELNFFVGEKELADNGTYSGTIVGGGKLAVGSTSTSLRAIQGELLQKEIASSGTADQVYLISETNVENDTLSVTIDGVLWAKVSSFVASEPEDLHYVVRQEMNDTLKVMFGDDLKGRVPSLGASILIQYVLSNGLDGNIFQGDKITELVTEINDIEGETVTLSVTNSTTTDEDTGNIVGAFVGGDDEEGIEEIRYEAPRVFRTGDRAVTRNDFIALLDNYSGVATSNAWGENEETPPNYDMFNRVNLCLLLYGWAHPTTTFKEQLSDYLYGKSMITVKYEFVEAGIIYVIPVLDVVAAKNYSFTQLALDIEEVLEAEFVLGTTSLLGGSKNYSNVVALTDNLTGVAYHHMVLEIYQEVLVDSSSEYGDTLDLLPIKEGSVRIFVGEGDAAIEAGRDDKEGVIETYGTDYTTTGTINYTTGVFSFSISPTPADDEIIAVRYQQNYTDRERDVVVGYNQICYLEDIDIEDIASAS